MAAHGRVVNWRVVVTSVLPAASRIALAPPVQGESVERVAGQGGVRVERHPVPRHGDAAATTAPVETLRRTTVVPVAPSTGSENVTAAFAVRITPVALFAGEIAVTVGLVVSAVVKVIVRLASRVPAGRGSR